MLEEQGKPTPSSTRGMGAMRAFRLLSIWGLYRPAQLVQSRDPKGLGAEPGGGEMRSEGPGALPTAEEGQESSLLDKAPWVRRVKVSFMHRKDLSLLSPEVGGGVFVWRDGGKDCLATTPRDAVGNHPPTLHSDPFHQPGCA